MSKVGILTFHYTTNYGGVLQASSLYKVINSLGYDVEIINFVPENYKPSSYLRNFGVKKSIKQNLKNLDILNMLKKTIVMSKYSKSIINNFDEFRDLNMKISQQVDKGSLSSILNNYSTIIVGSDQVWNPSQRKSSIYFLNFKSKYDGKKISYAADSTTKDIDYEDFETLKYALDKFNFISVRNIHSQDFVKKLTDIEPRVVADPTLLWDFDSLEEKKSEDYILTYILGEEIEGSHQSAIDKIKEKYGDIPVYSIKIPTMKFDFFSCADKTYYNLAPNDWISLFKNAKFVYTDSFHGVLFSLKFHKPFIAYYKEKLRATRFTDLGRRYGIDKFIVENVSEIEEKKSLNEKIDYSAVDEIIKRQKELSFEFLREALSK